MVSPAAGQVGSWKPVAYRAYPSTSSEDLCIPSKEMQAIARLESCQRQALYTVRAQAGSRIGLLRGTLMAQGLVWV